MEVFDILGPRSHPREPIGVKFRVAKRTNMPFGLDKFHVNRCNELPLRGENADFCLVGEFNTGRLPLRGILPVKTYKHHIFAPTAGERTYIRSLPNFAW